MFELLMTWLLTRKKHINTCTAVLEPVDIAPEELDAEPVDKIDEESQNTAVTQLFLEHFHTVAWEPENTVVVARY